jgi:beta-barrel assembly-enhancing protease
VQELIEKKPYHSIMVTRIFIKSLLAILFAAMPVVLAQGLPDLGDPSQAAFTPLQERMLGQRIMREARRDPTYYDDAEVTDYVSRVGNRLAARGSDTRQEFEFFLMRDAQINAFALPGGFIGVHTGLLLAAQSESEMAGVIAHEISHVTQRHIARMINNQQSTQWMELAALAIAILASRSNSQVAEAAATIGPALAIQQQLNFSRDFEREADRIGLQLLDKAGYDPQGMALFFERLQRATRVHEGGAPAFLRTHPVTFERIADMQSRAQEMRYRQVVDHVDFHLVRAKMKAEFDPPREAVAYFRESLADKRYLSEGGARYGLAAALLRARDVPAAWKEFFALRGLVKGSAIVDTLGCRIRLAGGDPEAFKCFREAMQLHPGHRALAYEYAEALLQSRQPDAALKVVEARLASHPDDHRLYLLQSRAYSLLNRRLALHRSQAEAYVRMGSVPAAIEQLQIGLKAGDGDYYQLSAAEARLRELRRLDAEERKSGARKK